MRFSVLLVLFVLACRPPATAEPPPSEPSLQVAVAPVEAEAPAAATTMPEKEPETLPVREGSPQLQGGEPAPLAVAAEPLLRARLPEPEGTVKASRIRPGEYECTISRGYRFRPCTIELDEHGRTILTISHSLLEIQGVLTDQGKWTHFDGIKTGDRPFGCFACQERCTTDPESCACLELPRVASAQCLLEPVRFRFREEDGQWSGRIEHHHYYGALDAEDGGPIYETDRFVFVMRR